LTPDRIPGTLPAAEEPMAIKSTIYKAELEIVDMDRHCYATHKLTLACHSSETEERLMVRLLAFALHADERLEFGKGISDSDEPDLWLKDLTGDIQLWIELGHPDERVLARACGRSKTVFVYTYSANPDRWWEPIKARFAKERNLIVRHVDAESAKQLAGLADRTMNLQCSVQDGEIWMLDNQGRSVQVRLS
jgi:uncharacterized protein YaeQ